MKNPLTWCLILLVFAFLFKSWPADSAMGKFIARHQYHVEGNCK